MVDFVQVNLADTRQGPEGCGFSPYIKVFCLKEKQKEYLHAINEQIQLTEQALISDDDRKSLLENLRTQKEKLEQSLKLSEKFADDHKAESKARDAGVQTLIANTDTAIIQTNKDRNTAVENEAKLIENLLNDEDLWSTEGMGFTYSEYASSSNTENTMSSISGNEVKLSGEEKISHNYHNQYHN
ncbi:hypothetical protein NOVO_02100 [Rickettsiales bacterium Ac37b]|nr:hypothetical protein NOVO_02100 [Rickettsiales bacterium Ac37b]